MAASVHVSHVSGSRPRSIRISVPFGGDDDVQIYRKKPNLRTESVGDSLAVFDVHHQKPYVLNATSALVFQHCDGETTLEQLVQIVRQQLRVPSSQARQLVWLSLAELDKHELIEAGFVPTHPPQRIVSRRDAMSLLSAAGLSMALLPFIIPVTAQATEPVWTTTTTTEEEEWTTTTTTEAWTTTTTTAAEEWTTTTTTVAEEWTTTTTTVAEEWTTTTTTVEEEWTTTTTTVEEEWTTTTTTVEEEWTTTTTTEQWTTTTTTDPMDERAFPTSESLTGCSTTGNGGGGLGALAILAVAALLRPDQDDGGEGDGDAGGGDAGGGDAGGELV
jgi:uncharacterized protein (TIGR03382 family)